MRKYFVVFVVCLAVFLGFQTELSAAQDEVKIQPNQSEKDVDNANDDEEDLISEEEEARRIDEINKINELNGVEWRAGKTSVSRLSKKGMKKLLGDMSSATSSIGEKLIISAESAQMTTLGAGLDWGSSYNGYRYVTPARNGVYQNGQYMGQGSCGSCWAWAPTAALESQVLIDYNTPYIDVDLSEQAVLSCSGGGDCIGGNPDQASYYLQTKGIPVESCFKYTATKGSCSNMKSACDDGMTSSNRYKISRYYILHTIKDYGDGTVDYFGDPNIATLKSALTQYGPLVTLMTVYQDFQYFNKVSSTAIYIHTWGSSLGLHNVLITGYDDAGQYFIAKNSWGPTWGYSGFFKIAYSQVANSPDGSHWCSVMPPKFGCASFAYGRAIRP